MGELVECRSDTSYAERPLAFSWQGQRWEVVEILKRWHSPGMRGFLVRASTGGSFELLYDEQLDAWTVRAL